MADLETLVRANYGTEEISADCREAVLEYLENFPKNEPRKLNFIKGLTKIGKELFEQNPVSFPRSALPALIDLHEEGIATAEELLRSKTIVDRSEVSADEYGGQQYLLMSYIHLKSHLADILIEMDHQRLYPTADLLKLGLQKAYELAVGVAKMSWQSEVSHSRTSFTHAARATFRLYEETNNLASAENAYHAIVGAVLLSEGEANANNDNKEYLKSLKRKAFIAQSVFRSIRKDKEIQPQQVLLWGGRAYHSTRNQLLEGELLPLERANYLYDLGGITSNLLFMVDSPRLPQRVVWHCYDFQDYVRQNNLGDELKHLVTAAESTLQYILGDLYETERIE